MDSVLAISSGTVAAIVAAPLLTIICTFKNPACNRFGPRAQGVFFQP